MGLPENRRSKAELANAPCAGVVQFTIAVVEPGDGLRSAMAAGLEVVETGAFVRVIADGLPASSRVMRAKKYPALAAPTVAAALWGVPGAPGAPVGTDVAAAN